MPEREEFREIGHCGGQIIVTTVTNDGRRSANFGVTHSRPVPASWFAVYALPQGIPVGMIELGGIGQPWNPRPRFVEAVCALAEQALYAEQDAEHVIDMDKVADDVQKTGERPSFYYTETSQQNHFTCAACGEASDIRRHRPRRNR